MGPAPARRVALLGGGFSTDDDRLLDDWVLAQTPAPRPRVCFVPTASGDADAYVEQFLDAFHGRDCRPSVLRLFRRELDDEELRTHLLSQDVVYVGGGSTANLLAVWRAHGVDRLMREAHSRGALVCGISAGANCWADACHTDSFGPLTPLRDGLGLVAGSVCPHYDSEPGRRASYRTSVAQGRLPAGWALEDGVGVLLENGRFKEGVTRSRGSRAYRVFPNGAALAEERGLTCRPLGR
ncbi:Type 1 glutamine amidotransferase-like domain-containing protein [Streptomyces chumphonensis]|uniref:Peptidase E n=1 Tax=Streptomyces chumphonensis TaxID=1214925 RepID=A0A927F1N3_9ACTN|nr:peptidase E [Streptomyces chumphonensis]MBD3933939.1 peptidase E [Streptomyces chumphonensis]